MKINGSLVFDASSASEIQNLRIQKIDGGSVPVFTSADTGRLIYVTLAGAGYSGNSLYYGTGAAWVAVATGGNAAALQTEVDNTQTSLGAIVTTNGVFVPGQMSIGGVTSTATTLTGMLQELAAYANANNTLSELDDVNTTGVVNGDFLRYVGAEWVDHTLVLANVTDVTATVAQVNVLATIPSTLSGTELGYVDGVTSSIQTQLDAKQALDAGLTSISALSAIGILTQTADNVFAARTLAAPTVGLTITNPAGVAGNPTFALANGLASIEALATTGFVVQSGADTFITRDLATASIGRITVSNGDGVAGAPTVDLATVTNSGAGTFLKLATDAYGRVTGTTAVVLADITTLADATYVNVTGDSMSGNLVFTSGTVTGLSAPTGGTDATNKNYVDSLVAGLSWKTSVRVATTGNVSLTVATATVDGVTLVAGNRILVKSQTAPVENGIYVFSAVGAPLTRSADLNEAIEFDGATVFITEGTANADTGWTQTAEVVTLGTSPVAFSQFTGANTYVAGTGIVLAGNTFNINLGAGIAELPSDEVGLDLFTPTAGGLVLTTDGTARSTASGASLHLLTGGASGLAQSTLGLFIAASGVTNAMMQNNSITLDADDTGSATVALGGTLRIFGTVGDGLSTALSAGGYIVSALAATATQRGTASFAAADFDVVGGAVSIKVAGVGNAQLEFSTVTLTGTTGSDAFALGESVAIVGGAGGVVSTAVTANQVEVSVRDATASLKGAASFVAADFLVTAGSVALVGKSITTATDVADATVPTAGHVLAGDGTAWSNKKVYHLETVGTASALWTVNHGIGQQFCVVTIVDASNEVVIPQSITFNSATQLTVTFNTSIAGKAVVMGMNLA